MADEKVTFRRATSAPASKPVDFCQEVRLQHERAREERELRGKNRQWGYRIVFDDDEEDDDNTSAPDWWDQ